MRTIKKFFKDSFQSLGIDIRMIDRNRKDMGGYLLYQYLDKQGNFDYQLYRKVQEEGNKEKIDRVWAKEENLKFIATYIKENYGTASFGLCHGTRRGKEQEWLGKHLGCEVLGTEISETATQFPNTIQWDFHEVKPEWVNNVDFIYSNSLDHSYDPEKCLNAWMSCVKSGGFCFIEHGDFHGPAGSDKLDPFGASIMIMPYLILQWGKGDYFVKTILDSPLKHRSETMLKTIVIQKA